MADRYLSEDQPRENFHRVTCIEIFDVGMYLYQGIFSVSEVILPIQTPAYLTYASIESFFDRLYSTNEKRSLIT